MPNAVLAPYVRREEPSWEVTCISESVGVERTLGKALYYKIADRCYEVGELLWAPLLHPEKTQSALSHCAEQMAKDFHVHSFLFPDECYGARPRSWETTIELTLAVLDSRLNALVDRLVDEGFDLVGMTTSFGQLLGNLALAKRLREKAPHVKVVLGGSTLSAQVGPKIMQHYPFVDFVIQGEGEKPLTSLARWMRTGEGNVDQIEGLLTRANFGCFPAGAKMSEISDMDELPMPDFSDHAATMSPGDLWFLTLEGSRGCWWDRVNTSGNAKKTCHFCNLNTQWKGYKEKSIVRIASEVSEQINRYGVTEVMFLDNVIRLKGVVEFAETLEALAHDLQFFYEMRANLSSYEVLRLWKAGLNRCQVGIESLSNSYLRRIGKGTTVMQNLLVMKLCQELGISNESNILTEFPGGTALEVEETVDVIRKYAWRLQPLAYSPFRLSIGSTVETLRADYPITNVRNVDYFRHAVPEEIYLDACLYNLDFDWVGTPTDWTPCMDAMRWWSQLYFAGRCGRNALVYYDAGASMRLVWAEGDKRVAHNLVGIERDLYFFCLQPRRFDEILERFRGKASADTLTQLLASWSERLFMYQEGNRHLALALAVDATKAARRIETQYKEDMARRPASRRSYSEEAIRVASSAPT